MIGRDSKTGRYDGGRNTGEIIDQDRHFRTDRQTGQTTRRTCELSSQTRHQTDNKTAEETADKL